jgi:hypothetical protein
MAGIFNGKDIDNRWWRVPLQQRDMSCGPTSVRITKELYHNQVIAESAMRGLVGMQHTGKANTGQSYSESDIQTDLVWRQDGTIENLVLPAVKASPFPIPIAHFVHGIAPLRNASRNHPAILGFNWDGGGGHFVVCVGPTKTDPDKFVILDPGSGLEYLKASEAVGNALKYNPSYGSKGTIDNIGFIITTA